MTASPPPADYLLCGWRLRSQLPLPELPPWRGDGRPPELVVALGEVPDSLAAPRHAGTFAQFGADGSVRYEIPGVAAYLIRQGRRIEVAPRMPVDSPDIGLFLLGFALGIVCHQNGLLPLHASCVELADGRAVAFAGESGAGKSTLAAALVQRGHRLLADDITVVDPRGDGSPMVRPAFPRQKLWRDTLDALGLTAGRRVRRDEAMEKFEHGVGHAFHAEPLPLAAVCHLAPPPLPGQPSIEHLNGSRAMQAAGAAIYRAGSARRLGLEAGLFRGSARLAATTRQLILRRPHGIDRLVDFAAGLPNLLEPKR